ncbi:MAG: TetR/AcrR family transcriptional regulator [Actinomycetia bacterium]|nr:TetR/AcrR family transcriptional regulator [Actinomycetes bacterium]
MNDTATDGEQRTAPSGPRAERKRQAILAAARALFLRDGFDASVDQIAAEAGVSKVTVYNHFGTKQALFVEIVKAGLDAPLGDTLLGAVDRLGDGGDLRSAMTEAARAWVREIRSDPDVLALRTLMAREAHRVPELEQAWRRGGPSLHHPAARDALAKLTASGRLAIPDPEVAILQLYSLLVFPHLVFHAYGTGVDDALADRLITSGVDMFLSYYSPRPA